MKKIFGLTLGIPIFIVLLACSVNRRVGDGDKNISDSEPKDTLKVNYSKLMNRYNSSQNCEKLTFYDSLYRAYNNSVYCTDFSVFESINKDLYKSTGHYAKIEKGAHSPKVHNNLSDFLSDLEIWKDSLKCK